MENLSTITCGTFLEELASKAPTPGGGAASALCGAVAAALTAMLANLTVGKAGSEENEQQTAQIIAAAGKLREELTALADDDAAVFGKFMAAYKMPKTTDEEKAARTAAIIVTGNPNAISDGTVSAIVARAALRSALYNVKINLGLIKDAAYVEQAEAKMQTLEAKALETEAFVLARTDEILK